MICGYAAEFELAVNVKAAEALGFEIPDKLLALAERKLTLPTLY